MKISYITLLSCGTAALAVPTPQQVVTPALTPPTSTSALRALRPRALANLFALEDRKLEERPRALANLFSLEDRKLEELDWVSKSQGPERLPKLVTGLLEHYQDRDTSPFYHDLFSLDFLTNHQLKRVSENPKAKDELVIDSLLEPLEPPYLDVTEELPVPTLAAANAEEPAEWTLTDAAERLWRLEDPNKIAFIMDRAHRTLKVETAVRGEKVNALNELLLGDLWGIKTKSLFEFAALNGNVEIMQMLLSRFTQPFDMTDPLSIALDHKHRDVLKLLLDNYREPEEETDSDSVASP